MPRYYFDIVDGQGLVPDDEGIEMADQRSAEIEASKSLTGMARDISPIGRHQMSIEVRTDEGPLFQASFIFANAATILPLSPGFSSDAISAPEKFQYDGVDASKSRTSLNHN